MLDGIECCVISATTRNEMTSKYHQWVRSCCRVTPHTQRKYRLTSEHLLQRMKMQPLHYFIDLKQLGYAGHVQRMSKTRMPKRINDAHLEGPRKTGRPPKSLANCVHEGLKRKGIDVSSWKQAAQNRNEWARVQGSKDTSNQSSQRCYNVATFYATK